MSASERLKQKKLQKLKERETESSGSSSKSAVDKNTPEAKGSQSEMEKLTEVANDILSATGNMDIYQETYESIQYKVSYLLVIFVICSEKKTQTNFALDT